MDKIQIEKFIASSRRGDIKTVSEMVFNGFDIEAVEAGCRTALYEASSWGHTDLVEFLIMAGAQIEGNERNPSPLAIASVSGHSSVVRHLLSNKADVNSKFFKIRPMTQATGASIYADNETSLDGYIKAIELLMKARANPFLRDLFGNTALGVAEADRMNRKIPSIKHDKIIQMLREYEKAMEAEMEVELEIEDENEVTKREKSWIKM